MKSTADEIRVRFDADVDRFSSLDTGQSATVDAPLALALVAEAAAAVTARARHVLDVGCGAGNYTLKLLDQLPNLDVTLLDLSRPMLDRAVQRVTAATAGAVSAVQGDVREVSFPAAGFDIILAPAVLHHLRTDAEWSARARGSKDPRGNTADWFLDRRRQRPAGRAGASGEGNTPAATEKARGDSHTRGPRSPPYGEVRGCIRIFRRRPAGL